MSKNKYVTTQCVSLCKRRTLSGVSTTQTQNGQIIGKITSIIVKPHRFIIETNVMTMVVKNEINTFSDSIDKEMFIGKSIISWKYENPSWDYKIRRFVFSAALDPTSGSLTDFYVDVTGNNNTIHYVTKKYGKVHDIDVTKHCIIIKTKYYVIKIKNNFCDFNSFSEINQLVGKHVINWERKNNEIIFKTKENINGRVYIHDEWDCHILDIITFYDPNTFASKTSYGKVTSIKIHNSVEITTTKGVFTFTGECDDDGIVSSFCPKINKCAQREMIGKKITDFEKINNAMIIYCDNTTYTIKTPSYCKSEDIWCITEIHCDEYFF